LKRWAPDPISLHLFPYHTNKQQEAAATPQNKKMTVSKTKKKRKTRMRMREWTGPVYLPNADSVVDSVRVVSHTPIHTQQGSMLIGWIGGLPN